MTHRSPDVIVISPHFDDAVLSIGGLISREVAAGRSVEVWTCFTAGPPLDQITPALRPLGDYSTRRDEDMRALGVLGAGHRWLDLRERIWREPPLRQDHHIFHTPPSADDFQSLPALRGVIRELLNGEADLYAPLGVGHHHDHIEVTLAVLLEMLGLDKFDRVRFYEDPYALGGACRRAHFVTRRRVWRLWESTIWASPRMGALVWAASMASKGPQIDDYLPEVKRLQWTYTANAVQADDEARKLAAIAKYESQVKAFGGMGAVSAFTKRGHAILGGEPIWLARPA